jgi:hypothetical protein
MKIELNFSHEYEIKVLDELPSGKKIYYYPGANTQGGKDGALIEITPLHGESWIGVFAFGEITPKGVSGVYALPNTDKLCVVSRGAGYFVSANNPTDWGKVKSIPVIDVRSVLSQGIVLFANYTELIAYDSSGVKWRTERLAFDSFEIVELTDNQLRGEYYDIRSEAKETFEVDLLTGRHVGSLKAI